MSIFQEYYRFRNKQFHEKNKIRLFKSYFENSKEFKLHIGCQGQLLEGWLNVDLLPKSRKVALMDATKPFPFNDGQFEFIFTEHMIEHISFSSAFFMLKECNRVMKKDGAIRISTPNLRFLIALYSDNLSDVEKEYLNHSRKYLDQNMPLNPATVINNFFRDWGHQFIYDFENLQFLLSRSGFRDIKEVEVGFSDCKELRGLEMHGNEIGVEFNRLESIVVEAKK